MTNENNGIKVTEKPTLWLQSTINRLHISLFYSTFVPTMKRNRSKIEICEVVTFAEAIGGISEVMLSEDVRQTNLDVAQRVMEIIKEAAKDGRVEIVFAKDIRKYIDILQQEGLSPLIVDSALQIRLPLYELILNLPPLAKALYLLYVRHPEGLYRKQIADFKDELEALYQITSGCTDLVKTRHSIEQLTDFSKKNMDRQMCIIHKTFRQALGDKAVHYLPCGGRSQVRKLDFERVSFHLTSSVQGELRTLRDGDINHIRPHLSSFTKRIPRVDPSSLNLRQTDK